MAVKKSKRQRTDTSAADITAFSSAGKHIEPPKPLDKSEQVYWLAIIKARAAEDWTAIDLFHAWNLSKLMAQIEQSHLEIATQGMTIQNERGTPIDNPAFGRLEKLTRLCSSLSAKLHIHAEATVGRSEDSVKRSTRQREIQNLSENLNKNELGSFIARPNLN